MNTLTAELRRDVSGKLVTRHVKTGVTSMPRNFSVPVPAIAADSVNEPTELDDVNIMASLGVYDESSADCERVENYLEDEYGASFNYDDGAETITFTDPNEAQRFTMDLADGDLKSDLTEMLDEYR